MISQEMIDKGEDDIEEEKKEAESYNHKTAWHCQDEKDMQNIVITLDRSSHNDDGGGGEINDKNINNKQKISKKRNCLKKEKGGFPLKNFPFVL